MQTPLASLAETRARFSDIFGVACLLHVALIALLIWQSQHNFTLGNATGEPPQEVEVTFDPPERGALQGPQSREDKGAIKRGAPSEKSDNSPNDAAPNDATHGPQDGGATPQVATPPLPQDKGTMHAALTPSQAPVTTNTRRPSPAKPPRHARAAPRRQSTRNPFAHMQSLDFDDRSPSPRKHRGRYGGSHGPIDLSYGPLVSNGSVNAPSLSVRKIRGVSEDYGAELSKWIRSHLFYPEDAVANGEEGATSLHVRLNRQGVVTAVRVTNQSGSYALDAAAMSIFSMQAKLPPIPPDMTGDHFDIDLTINYILIRG